MPRDLPSAMITQITSAAVRAAVLLDLTLKSSVEYVWSGVGSFVWSGHTYRGVGSFGAIGEIMESTEVKADGTSVQLSGIDPALLTESLNDIQLGAPVTLWLAVFSEAGALLAAYPIFVGTVDRPQIPIGPETIAIQLALETRMANLQRATNRRYTTADQRGYFPGDIGFNWVEVLNDIALIWG